MATLSVETGAFDEGPVSSCRSSFLVSGDLPSFGLSGRAMALRRAEENRSQPFPGNLSRDSYKSCRLFCAFEGRAGPIDWLGISG